MNRPRSLTTVAHGIFIEMTFWLIFMPRATTSLPMQTIDEVLQNGEYIVITVTVKIFPFIFYRITSVFVKAGFLNIT
jgi:hypothetical protein